MIYLIFNSQQEAQTACNQISQNMGFSDTDEVTKSWDVPIQINASSGEGINSIPSHQAYIIDPTTLGKWAVIKPSQRFMYGVTATEVSDEIGDIYFSIK